MANLCGTCKHWDREGGDFNEGDGVGMCIAILGPQDRPRGMLLGDWEKSLGNWLAKAEDGSDYYAALRCRESFGCVLWEGVEA